MFMSSLVEFWQRFGINSSHSYLGISMDAIEARIFAIWLRTRVFGEASVAKIAIFIWFLNSESRLTQKLSYLASFERLMMKFLKIMEAICRVGSSMDSSAISLVRVARNFF